ncbi:hypothetical protein FDZ73_23970 [bacterium]|nr:MAG: hypothetical protein FDZ73_23970 [bacterium]
MVEKWLEAHVEITENIVQDPEKYKTLVNAQLKALTKKDLSKDILDSSFARLTITNDPVADSIKEFVGLSVDNGYLKKTPDIEGLINLEPLNRVLKAKGLTEIK